MSNDEESRSKMALESWINEAKSRREIQHKNIQLLASAKHLDEAGFRALDSTLKKVTAFMKKLKSIGTTVSPSSLLPELEKLNVSKFLDEIAANICEAKVKISDIPALVEFCVKVSSMYSAFPGILTSELKKHVPFKKSDSISNASKLRVDVKFLADLILSGVLQKEGIQLLGSVLSFIVNTDKLEHVNVNILLPFCRSLFFDVTNVLPLEQMRLSKALDLDMSVLGLASSMFNDDQRNAVINLFNSYLESLMQHVNEVRLEMNRLHKSIKRQERTRGDASNDDRQKFEQAKTSYDRLRQSAMDLTECLGAELPAMAEEPSDDEQDELAAKKLDLALNEGRIMLWPDSDTQLFYEKLSDVRRMGFRVSSESIDEEQNEAENAGVDEEQEDNFADQVIAESIENVDVTNLDVGEEMLAESGGEQSQVDDEEERSVMDEEMDEGTIAVENEDGSAEDVNKMSNQELMARQASSATIKEFLGKLVFCINKQLIDNAALEFMTHFNRKAYRKKLIQAMVNAPVDRLDLLPFYARFLAILKSMVPEVTSQVMHELLSKFREVIRKQLDISKKGDKKASATRIDQKVHLSKFISELTKFSIIPKAEALTCLRSLLVDLRQYKIDMMCAMVESMGLFLYRSPESHAKMKVIMDVLRVKALKIKDPRQQILLENAYFSVIPPEEQSVPVHRLPPIYEFLQTKIISSDNRLQTFRKINWDDEDLSDFVLKMLANPGSVRFEDIDRLASLVGALSDYHKSIGVFVVDDVMEFIRLALEMNDTSLQQRCLSSVIYLGQLFNYNVCGTSTVFWILYQLITFNVSRGLLADDLIIGLQRIRLVLEMASTIFEFFCKGTAKTKMDCFLYYFLQFYYETKEKWAELDEQLGEFPKDIKTSVEELLKTWRAKEKFPGSLVEAKDYVENIEKKYKNKVEEIMKGIRVLHGDDDRDERRLRCIMEEEDEEDLPEEDSHKNTRRGGAKPASQEEPIAESQSPSAVMDEDDDEEEEEQIYVHTERHVLPEDEDFMRDLDRIMTETMMATPAALKGPMTDLEVPPLARQKFERKITFATDPTPYSPKGNYGSILPDSSSAAQGQHFQMALMTRGKGNKGTVLKAVKIESSEDMHESWRQYQEQRERERKEMKHVTLAMNDRIQHQQQEEQLQQLSEAMNGVRMHNPE